MEAKDVLWAADLDKFLKRYDGCFKRRDCRALLCLPVYVQGQLADLERKSVEPIALNAGVPARSLQQFLARGAQVGRKHACSQTLARVAREHGGPRASA